jgi:dephospho-CoA kinase
MKIIGLTGSIGMGKSVLADQFRSIGVPVHDADAVVHELMRPYGAAFNDIKQAFPDVIIDGKIDRKLLGQIVFNDDKKRELLENILHPLVRASSNHFIAQCRKARAKICVLDIPLLFETGRDMDMDSVICVSAPSWVQKRRVLARPNMTQEKFKSIVSAQIPDYRKRCLSDHIIISARGKRHTLNTIKRIKNNER